MRRLPPLSQEEREASLQREFRRLDPDGNGHIEPAELLARLLENEAGQAAELTMRDVTLIINRLDGFAGQKDGVLEKGEVRVTHFCGPRALALTRKESPVRARHDSRCAGYRGECYKPFPRAA